VVAILFLCMANASRSQLAEGLSRHIAPEVEVFSAGFRPTVVNAKAALALAEIGIDASTQWSKGLRDVPLHRVRTVVHLVGEVECVVPIPRAEHLDWQLPDPTSMDDFRIVRDYLRERLERYFFEERVPRNTLWSTPTGIRRRYSA